MEEKRTVRTGENFFIWLMLILSVVILILAYRISGFSSNTSPGTFPMFAGAVMVLTMVLSLLENRKFQQPDTKGLGDALHKALVRMMPWNWIAYTLIVIAYTAVLPLIHFYPSSFIFVLISMVYLKGAGWLRSFIITTGSLIAVYLIFEYVFRVTLP